MRSRILKDNLILSEFQKDVLIGLLLGDGCLHRRKLTHGVTLKVCQCLKQKEFVMWIYEVFKDFVRTPPQVKTRLRNGKCNYEAWFNTLTHPLLEEYYSMFYRNREKIIPESIDNLLTETAFAVWFMSDGSVKSQECRGRILNTQSFSKPDIERLITVLREKFNLKTSIRTQKDGLQIYISAKSAEVLNAILKDKILPLFQYKLPIKS